jgi:hypothetical protein
MESLGGSKGSGTRVFFSSVVAATLIVKEEWGRFSVKNRRWKMLNFTTTAGKPSLSASHWWMNRAVFVPFRNARPRERLRN